MENIKELLQELRCDIACIPRTEDNKEEIKNATQTLQKAWNLVSESDSLPCVISWVAVSEKLPPRPDEDYLVCVRNKNKEGGIPIQDIGNFSSDGVWIKQNTWEDVVYWAELPKPPCV